MTPGSTPPTPAPAPGSATAPGSGNAADSATGPKNTPADRSATADPPTSIGQRQITALADLIDLSNTCDRVERGLLTGSTGRTAQVQQRYDRTSQRFLSRTDRQHRRATRDQEQGRAKLAQTLDQQRRKLDTDVQTLRDRIGRQQTDARGKVQGESEHDRWVAESVLEGRLNELRGERQKDLEQLEAMQEFADAYVVRARTDLKHMRHGHVAPATLADLGAGRADARPAGAADPVADVATRLADYPAQRERLTAGFRRLHGLLLPMLFLGPIPYALWFLVTLGLTVGLVWWGRQAGWPWSPVLVGGGGFLIGGALVWLVGRTIFNLVSRRVVRAHEAYEAARREHHGYLQGLHDAIHAKFDRRADEARAAREASDQAIRTRFQPMLDRLESQHAASSAELEQKYQSKLKKLTSKTQRLTEEFEQQAAATLQAIVDRRERRLDVARRRRDRDLAAAKQDHESGFADLQQRWDAGRDRVLASLQEMRQLEETSNRPWDDPAWQQWDPPAAPGPAVRFGTLHIDVNDLIDQQASGGRFDLSLPASLHVPALLSGPDRRSFYVAAPPDQRDTALQMLTSVILRLLTTLPPGRAKFTLIDPIGLGESFGSLMHLADHEDSLVNGRVWSEPLHIDRRLTDLTEHMGQMIQKYLRNDYESIDDYNTQAGELAEPYRFLVVADYPHGFSTEAAARLNSVAASGSRSGVFVLVLHDPRTAPPQGELADLTRHCTVVSHRTDDGWRWRHPVTQRFAFTPDRPPGEALTTQLLGKVGRAAIDAGRVQVPFATITPDPGQRWSRSAAEDVEVLIGRTGATRLQNFRLGHGVAQHALVAGKTGSGKSSLLHTLVTNLCLWYPPDQLELYLIDFKKGVEFKPYVSQRPPHLRAIAIESDREFGLSILRHLDAMLDHRGQRFRDAGVANLAAYHQQRADEPMPRVMLIVDEFQELFGQDDAISQHATGLLDRLVRQGRAFGMHVFLGSQSLSGAAGLPRGTFGQMGVRVALQCSESDSQLILGDENSAARLLTRPGEAIYNDQGGSLEANSLFQVAWLPDHELRQQLTAIDQLRRERGVELGPCHIFEGSAPAELSNNRPLSALLDTDAEPPGAKRLVSPPGPATPPLAYLGEPIAISDPVSVALPRVSGANVVILGQDAEATLGLMQSSLLSLVAALPPDAAHFVFFNGSSEPQHDAAIRETLAAVPHRGDAVAFRDVDATLAKLHTQLQQRMAPSTGDGEGNDAAPAIYLYLFGLQRFRQLRASDNDFSFSLDDDPPGGSAAGKPDAQLLDLLRDGPAHGIHLIVACDRAASLEQVFDRRALREFDHRVMFQMSANDSAQLIDSSEANDLGPHRALLYREDRGTVTRFRPYGPPTPADLQRFHKAFASYQAPASSTST